MDPKTGRSVTIQLLITDWASHTKLSRKEINARLSSTESQKPDMLGSFMKRGLTPDQAEMEISISL